MPDASMSASNPSMSDQAPKAKSALVSPEESPSAADGFNPRIPRVNSAWAWQRREQPFSCSKGLGVAWGAAPTSGSAGNSSRPIPG